MADLGFEAEENFLSAMEHLGYRNVGRTNAFAPRTIRRTETFVFGEEDPKTEEDRMGIDFVITPQRDGLGWSRPVVPLQLTVSGGFSEQTAQRIEIKKSREGRGLIALFWPVKELGQSGAIELLRDAADGNPRALEWLDRQIDEVLERFFQYRTKRIIRMGLLIMYNEIDGKKVSWPLLESLAPRFARELRREISAIMASDLPGDKREERARRMFNRYKRFLYAHGGDARLTANHSFGKFDIEESVRIILCADDRTTNEEIGRIFPHLPKWMRIAIKRIRRSHPFEGALEEIRGLVANAPIKQRV